MAYVVMGSTVARLTLGGVIEYYVNGKPVRPEQVPKEEGKIVDRYLLQATECEVNAARAICEDYQT